MKNFKNVVFVTFLASAPLMAAEDCPVSKISLARGLACETYALSLQASEADSKMDAICLKLGRVSAILRRTQGQLSNRPTAPVPPVEWKQRAIEIEGFCGVGTDKTLPRGLVNPEYVTNGYKNYIRDLIQETSDWIKANSDVEGIDCPAPAQLSSQDQSLCL